MTRYIAAVDQGTTSTRCILFNRAGEITAISRRDHQQIYPQPGWVEHDPLEIWRNTQHVLQDVLARANLVPDDLAALGITNQRETTVAWSPKSGKPVTNALVWQDTRTDAICKELMEGGGKDRFREKTGLPISTYFSGPKIRWILDQVPGAREAVDAGDLMVGTMDSWLVWNLTGGADGGQHRTDSTNASRTLLMDLERREWAEEILDLLSIPRGILPAVQASSSHFGETASPFSGVPITGILGDQQAALFGQTCYRKGEAKNTYGTGCFLLLNTGAEPIPSQNGLITTIGYHL